VQIRSCSSPLKGVESPDSAQAFPWTEYGMCWTETCLMMIIHLIWLVCWCLCSPIGWEWCSFPEQTYPAGWGGVGPCSGASGHSADQAGGGWEGCRPEREVGTVHLQNWPHLVNTIHSGDPLLVLGIVQKMHTSTLHILCFCCVKFPIT